MSKTIIYHKAKYDSKDIRKFHKEGYSILCPVCNSKLSVITSLEEAKVKKPGHPGIFCPNSPDHVYITFNMGRKEFWKRFEKKMVLQKKQDIADMKQKGYTEEEIKAQIAKDYPD